MASSKFQHYDKVKVFLGDHEWAEGYIEQPRENGQYWVMLFRGTSLVAPENCIEKIEEMEYTPLEVNTRIASARAMLDTAYEKISDTAVGFRAPGLFDTRLLVLRSVLKDASETRATMAEEALKFTKEVK